MSNLKLVGKQPAPNNALHPTPPYSKVVKKALERNLPLEIVEEIVYGFKRSKSDQQALIDDYMRCNIEKHPILKDEHYCRALNRVSELFSPGETYRPVSYPDLRYYPWTLPSSAEAPFTSDLDIKRILYEDWGNGLIPDTRITFHNLYNRIFIWNRQNVHRIKDGINMDLKGRSLLYWNTAHARSHLVKSDEDDKVRMVYGIPKLLLQIECMFIWPILNHLISTDGPMLWGYETLKGGWYKTYNWHTTKHPQIRTWLAFDWKQFDKRISYDVLDDIHEIMRNYMTFEHGYWPTKDYPDTHTDPKRLERLWNWMRHAIKFTPDLLPNGELYQRQHSGLPSGFLQTQLTGSMYNTLMLLTVLSRMGININSVAIKVQGDDSIIGLREYIPTNVHQSFIDTFAKYSKEYFGAILNTKKSEISNSLDGLTLLGFKNINGIPIKGRNELLASLLHPEHQTDFSRLMARAIGIAWANCGAHSDVYRVCEDVFTSLKECGYSPDMAGLPDVIKSMALMTLDSLDHFRPEFPSFYDTIRHLTTIFNRTKQQAERFWPSDHFLLCPQALSLARDTAKEIEGLNEN